MRTCDKRLLVYVVLGDALRSSFSMESAMGESDPFMAMFPRVDPAVAQAALDAFLASRAPAAR